MRMLLYVWAAALPLGDMTRLVPTSCQADAGNDDTAAPDMSKIPGSPLGPLPMVPVWPTMVTVMVLPTDPVAEEFVVEVILLASAWMVFSTLV